MSTSQIISGHSHSFDTGIAKSLGIHAAIVYNHIEYWIKRNSKKPDAQMFEGRYWMYETQKEMAEFLEYMTVEEVKRAIIKLVDSGLLIKGNFNTNPFDRTSWYSLSDNFKKTLSIVQYRTIESATPHDPQCDTAPCIYNEQEQHLHKEQQTEQQPLPVSVCPSNSDLSSVPSDDPSVEAKTKAFNWFMKIGCDALSATFFVENFSLEDIRDASGYVKKQIDRKKLKNETITDVVGYLRRTLEGKWWIKETK